MKITIFFSKKGARSKPIKIIKAINNRIIFLLDEKKNKRPLHVDVTFKSHNTVYKNYLDTY